MLNRMWTGTLLAASCLASPALAAPRYQATVLPDLGGNSRARSFAQAGSLRVAVGDVNDAGQEALPAFWFLKGRKWSLDSLSDLGHGGSASSFWLGSNDALGAAVVGTVRDEAGDDIAALWTLQRTRRGWTDTLVPLTPPGDGPSEAASIVESIDFPSYIVGHRAGIAPGSTVAAIWDHHQACTVLPAPGGGSAEAIRGVELPNGDLRILGCLEVPPGSGLEFAVEWTGNPKEGFSAQLLPEPGLGLEEYHVLGVDPLLRFAVGARFFPGGAFEPAGWATFPWSVGAFNPLSLPSTETGGAHLYAVNSFGRALGVVDAAAQDTGTLVTRVNVPESDSRRIPLASLVDNNSNSLAFRGAAISRAGVLSGSASVLGRRRACLLAPTDVEAPDLVSVEGWEDDVEVAALVWDDTDVVHINDQTPADWNELRVEIDGTRFFDIPSEFQSQLQAAARRQGPALLVTARFDGPKSLVVQQRVWAWNFQTLAWNIIADVPGHCGAKFQRLRYPLPSAIGPYLSPSGSLRLRLAFTPAAGSSDSLDVLVNSVGLNARELALDDYSPFPLANASTATRPLPPPGGRPE